MRGQFLLDMLIGWVVYTKEGKETANKLVQKSVEIAKDYLLKSDSNIGKILFECKDEKNEKPNKSILD